MPGRDRRLDRALHRSRELSQLAGREIFLARAAAGLSQDEAGAAVGMSGSQFGRIERGELRSATVEQLCRASAAVGLRPSLRLYPDGDPLRDTAQGRLLGRLHVRVPALVGWHSEVPVYGQTDLRSWDAQLWFPDGRVGLEAETRLRDGQAQVRRAQLKLRDDPTVQRLILLIADTRSNRRAMSEIRELLRHDLPLDTRAVLAAIEAGRMPSAGGIVFL